MKMANPYSRRDFVALSVAGPLWDGCPGSGLRNSRWGTRALPASSATAAPPGATCCSMATRMPRARCSCITWNRSARTAYLIEGAAREVGIAGGKLDPNRMFSRAGAADSLRNLNPGWNDGQVTAALDLLDGQREKLLDALIPPDRGLLIALGSGGAASATDAAATAEQRSLPQPDKSQAFYLCTDPADYQALAASPYNVVLSRNVRARDDGSLERRASARDVASSTSKPAPATAPRSATCWPGPKPTCGSTCLPSDHRGSWPQSSTRAS